MKSTKKTSKWRKVLYEDQGVPDNYTDESFLEEMKKNVNTQMYDFKSVVFESGIVSQQVATISIFVSTFIYMDAKLVQSHFLLLIIALLFIAALAMRCYISSTNSSCNIGRFLTVCVLVFALSPVLKTLTKTISTDTIYAMTTCMLIANLLFHDYGAGVAIVSKAISLNTSIFAAICLASRLSSVLDVYVYVMLAIQLFALFPEFRKDIKAFHRRAYIALTEALMVIAAVLLIPISLAAAGALVLSHFSITFLFPLWMVRLQQLKNNIHGPWDEAMIKR